MSAYSRLSTTKWIAGVLRGQGNRVALRLQHLDGGTSVGTFSDLAPMLKVADGRLKRVLTVQMSEFEVGSVRDYLGGIGLPSLDAGGQQVYVVETHLGPVWVPAQLMILAMFGTNALTRPYLMSPLGLHMAMRSFEHRQGMRLVETPMNPRRGADDREYGRRKLEWALHYPSAVAAWASIFAHAAHGRVAITLPNAVARLKLTGCSRGSDMFATGLSLVTVTPTEQPLEFARGRVPTDFVFHDGLRRDFSGTTRAGPPAARSEALMTASRGQPLTDAQWARLEPRVRRALQPSNPNFPGQPLRFPLRYLLDVLSLKFGTPLAWRKVPYPRAHVRAAKYVYLKLLRLGCWDEILKRLAGAGEMRAGRG